MAKAKYDEEFHEYAGRVLDVKFFPEEKDCEYAVKDEAGNKQVKHFDRAAYYRVRFIYNNGSDGMDMKECETATKPNLDSAKEYNFLVRSSAPVIRRELHSFKVKA